MFIKVKLLIKIMSFNSNRIPDTQDTIRCHTIDSIRGKEFDIVIVYCDNGINTGDLNIDQWVKIVFTRARSSLFVCFRDPINLTGGPPDEVHVSKDKG